MKLRKILALVLCLMVLPVFSFSAFAIGFDAEEKYNAVFVVTSGNSLGSGFAIGENCIVTNAHVLGSPEHIVLTTYSGEQYNAVLVGMDETLDVAVVSVLDAKFDYLKIQDYKAMDTGDDVYAVGAPKSMAYTLTKGVISSKEREISGQTYIQTDAAVNEGNSGGPLMNDKGDVIGINTLKMSDSEGIGLAIPMNVVCNFVKSLGIKVDENGNVDANVKPSKKSEGDAVPPKSTSPKNPDSPKSNTDEKAQLPYPIEVLVVFAVAAISIVLNIVLVINLIFQKRKNLTLKYDPRERTDFDIDILE